MINNEDDLRKNKISSKLEVLMNAIHNQKLAQSFITDSLTYFHTILFSNANEKRFLNSFF